MLLDTFSDTMIKAVESVKDAVVKIEVQKTGKNNTHCHPVKTHPTIP